ncbi:MAG: hypothetical protein WHT46_08720 [Candidatus Geothermincolales bacterium]
MRHRKRPSCMGKGIFSISLVLAMSFLLLFGGCREAEQMQAFSDQVISIVRERFEDSATATSASRNLAAYLESGFSDLESARKAASDLGQVHESDLELVRKIEEIREPDAMASDILLSLRRGFQAVDNGNYAVKKELENAERQDRNERSGLFQRIIPALEESLSGLQTVLSALENLQRYMGENQLEGMDDLAWLMERIAKEKGSVQSALESLRNAGNPR